MSVSIPRLAAIREVPRRRRMPAALAALAVALVAGAAPRIAAAAEPAAVAADPSVVVARTVHPRIAYRALPAQDNPVRTEATTFPARVFHATADRSLAPLLDDGALGQRGSAGIGVAAATQAAAGLLVPATAVGAAHPSGGPGAAAPLGASASAGGAVIGATAGLGDTITGAVMQALAPPPGGGQ